MWKSFKESFELHVKYTSRTALMAFLTYFVYVAIRENMTGIVDQSAVQIITYGFSFLHYVIFWFIVPRWLFRKLHYLLTTPSADDAPAPHLRLSKTDLTY